MMATPLSKISEKIRKILALSKSSNAQEASNAAALAQKLMQEHKLTEADVSDLTSDGSDITEVSLGSEGFLASWKFALVSVTARAFFCEAIALRTKTATGTKRVVKIVGRKNDMEIAAYVFAYLVKEIDRLAAAEINLISEDPDLSEQLPTADVRAYKDSYRRGAAMGIANKLKHDTTEFARSSEKAMVVVKKSSEEVHRFMNNKYSPKIADIDMDKTSKPSLSEKFAMARGYDAGSQISIPTRTDEQGKIGGK